MPLQIVRADITKLDVDAIVCPTNTRLLPGSGIDYAVHMKAGRDFTRQCVAIDHIEEGDAVVIDGCALPSKYVIMTVGPHWKGGGEGEAGVLEKAYRSSLEKVEELSLSSVAVPLISAGYYGVPDSLSLKTATEVIRKFLSSYDAEVYLVVYNSLAFDLSKGIFHEVAQLIDEEEVEAWEKVRGKSKYIPSSGKGRTDSSVIYDTREADDEQSHPHYDGRDESDEEGNEPVRHHYDESELEMMEKGCSEGFSDYLRNKVLEKGMTGVECYKKANISHKLYSKIMCDKNYKPGRDTTIAFALALKLPPAEFSEMLAVAGFALSPVDRRDIVIRYFVDHGRYDILQLNEVLFGFDLVPLGYKK